MIALRSYQQEAIDAVLAARERGVLRQLIALPTGTGKTVVFGSLARELAAKTVILAHRDELIEQAVDKLQLVGVPADDIGVVKAERDETGRQVTVASVQTLARPGRLEALDGCELLVTDEAHHGVAPTYRRIYDRMGDVLHVGVTATPQRSDKAGLGDIYQEVVYHKSLLEMIQAGYLSDLRGLRVRTDVDLSAVRTVAGDFVDSDLADAVNTPERNGVIVGAWKAHAQGRKTLVFTVDVQHAADLAHAFIGAGVKAASVWGQMPIEERRATLEAFGRGDLEMLCNCQLLTEGYDEPGVNCIIVARPTQSQSCYIQMIGRGTRLYPGKDDCLILDVADNTRRHNLVQLPNLFGLQYKASGDGRPTAGILKQVQEREQMQRQHSNVPLIVESVDLFGRSQFGWLQVGNSWFLPVPGHGQIRLSPFGKAYVATLYLDSSQGGGQRPLTDRALDLGWAQGVAEEEARRLLQGKTAIINRDAPWRREPATPKQLDTLWKMGFRPWPGMTKGQASDRIAGMVAQSRAR